MQDPVLLFGVHGALVSGIIAARALGERQWALREFRRMNRLWALSWFNRRLLELTFPWGVRGVTHLNFEVFPRYSPFMTRGLLNFIPGWHRI